MTEETARPLGANGEGLPLSKDLLCGAGRIAEFIYGKSEDPKQAELNVRRAYHAIAKGDIPTFKIGGKIHARKSSILRRIEERERGAA